MVGVVVDKDRGVIDSSISFCASRENCFFKITGLNYRRWGRWNNFHPAITGIPPWPVRCETRLHEAMPAIEYT